jgi:hypothetical protein
VPDRNTGLWDEVVLLHSGPATLFNAFAAATLSDDLSSAVLRVEVELLGDSSPTPRTWLL